MTTESRSNLGCVGDSDGAVAAACRAAGASVTEGTAEGIVGSGHTAIVVVGPESVREVCFHLPTAPVLAVDADPGLRAIPPTAVEAAVETVLAGEAGEVDQPVLSVRVAGESRIKALFDAMLITAEPAHISAYEVLFETESVDRFRADGVLAATPAGSAGYARAAGGPVIPAGAVHCAVVPIAPFATATDHWVLPVGATELRVAREETAVELVVDGVDCLAVTGEEAVTFDVAGSVATLQVPASRSPFAPPAESEKL